MFADATEIRMELMKIRTNLEKFKENKDKTKHIKELLKEDTIHYYPLGGYTPREAILTGLFPRNSEYFFNDLFIGSFEGIMIRRSDVHYLKEFFDDGAIRDDFTEGARQHDSLLFEVHFENKFANGLLITTQDSSEKVGFQLHKDIESFHNLTVYEELIPKYSQNKGMTVLGAASVVFDFATLRFGGAISTLSRMGNNESLMRNLEFVKNESFDISQILNPKLKESIVDLQKKYGDIELSFTYDNLYIKLIDKHTFDGENVSSTEIDNIKSELEEMIALARQISSNAFSKEGDM